VLLGNGVDIIEIERLTTAIERWGDHFLKHVFCDEEIEYAHQHKNAIHHFAGRFAAKEAILKAFGDNAHIGWKDIKIMNDKFGRPFCVYNDKKFKHQIFVSISHTHNYAVASAIITA